MISNLIKQTFADDYISFLCVFVFVPHQVGLHTLGSSVTVNWCVLRRIRICLELVQTLANKPFEIK
jgi:hypothetical protein